MTLRSQRNARAAANRRVTQVLGRGSALEGEKAPLANEEAVSRDAQGGVMVKATPAPSFVVIKPEFLLQLLVVPFDPPAQLGDADQVNQGGRRRQGRQPVLARLLLPLRPLDQQPFLGVRLGPPVVAVRRPHSHGDEAPLQFAAAAFPPAYRLPSARWQGQGEILGSDRLVLGIP